MYLQFRNHGLILVGDYVAVLELQQLLLRPGTDPPDSLVAQESYGSRHKHLSHDRRLINLSSAIALVIVGT